MFFDCYLDLELLLSSHVYFGMAVGVVVVVVVHVVAFVLVKKHEFAVVWGIEIGCWSLFICVCICLFVCLFVCFFLCLLLALFVCSCCYCLLVSSSCC